jgi:hypothetical protein
METLDREIGTAPEGEPQRIARYLELRDKKRDEHKRQALKEKITFEMDAEGDIWKSGKVVQLLALVLGACLLLLAGLVWKDLDVEQPWRREPNHRGPKRQQQGASSRDTSKKNK